MGEQNYLPSATQAKAMTEAELTDRFCAYYSVVKGRDPSADQKKNLQVLARYYQEFRIPHWTDVQSYIDKTDADQPPEAVG
jgi:hypothetical protein